MTTEVEYRCPTCNVLFVVYHMDDARNTHCCWCQCEVVQTGTVRRIEGNHIITCVHGQETKREIRPDLRRLKLVLQ